MTPPTFAEVEQALRDSYGQPRHHNKYEPLAELVFILLSTQTREAEYRRTFTALWRRYPSWDHVRRAPIHRIEEEIRLGGFARRKAGLLKEVLQSVHATRGRTSLRFLHRFSDEAALRYLLHLPGVGLKTAKCIMMYSLGRDVLPVDTHVWRIAQRLGWLGGGKHPDARRSLELESRVPPTLRHSLHVTMVAHGRDVCRAVPRCGACVLLTGCPEGSRRLRAPGMPRSIRALAVAEYAEGDGTSAQGGQPLHRRGRA